MSRLATVLSFAALLAALMALAMAIGPTGLRAPWLLGDAVIGLRAPRVLLAAIVGASLAISGVGMQVLLQNDLASLPFRLVLVLDDHLVRVPAGPRVGSAISPSPAAHDSGCARDPRRPAAAPRPSRRRAGRGSYRD